ncbi:AlpA family transcriptional regulator [Chromatocurvus halotolerans]|uniref:AlpA family transcriptional regulator n=1 Tax=Chromatocurvus halotolerans TaxID=1132028 RepID=A0A4R2L202_9GAMM|nr:AlpA family transcriptional regulator [Chromatocurvus halotolerans]
MPETVTPIRLVKDRTLAVALDVDRSTIWRWVREGTLPPPMRIGPNSTRFDLRACLDAIQRGEREAAKP